MAGISGYYYIGTAGGFQGADGLLGKDIEIEVWESDRMALVASKYYTDNYQPIYKDLRKFIPHGPNDKDMVRIAVILFASNLFKDCPSYEKVKLECEGIDYIDFSSKKNVPRHFYDLLEESRKIELDDRAHMFYSCIDEIKI